MNGAAKPGAFFAAVEHGLALLAVGLPLSQLSVMSRGASRLGQEDAASGYDHARLRAMAGGMR
jgi:hypothetical protein